jgi:hypothetical protein
MHYSHDIIYTNGIFIAKRCHLSTVLTTSCCLRLSSYWQKAPKKLKITSKEISGKSGIGSSRVYLLCMKTWQTDKQSKLQFLNSAQSKVTATISLIRCIVWLVKCRPAAWAQNHTKIQRLMQNNYTIIKSSWLQIKVAFKYVDRPQTVKLGFKALSRFVLSLVTVK